MSMRRFGWTPLPVGALCGALIASLAFAQGTVAQDKRHHALSLIGEPRKGPDFKHFDWVNPDAPKGGRVRQYAEGSFDSLNPWPVQGVAAGGIGLLTESLFKSSPDEASAEYAYIAEWASYPSDYSSCAVSLRPEARWHDGKPITVDDVLFSLDALKKVSPQHASYFADVDKAEKTGEREVTFRFKVKNNRELPHIVTQLPILPKHWWEGKDANGQARDISKSSMEVPLGSGPYKVKALVPGREITLERVKDHWAKDLPLLKGQYNFDEYQIIYFRERIAAFESFKSGALDYWVESSAKAWAVDFAFPAVDNGLVKKITPARKRVTPMQGFYMNLRRPLFQDVRVRRAMNLAFDFEWANKNLFYGLYTRTGSYFANSELAATGLPQGRELEILTEVKGKVPVEVFTTEWKNPVNNSPDDARKNLSEAAKLLAAAGYTPKNGVLTNAAGKPLEIEVLLNSPAFERVLQPYKSTLEKIGVKINIRVVDSAQYERRERDFDFDMTVHVIAQSESPGNEQRSYWGSAMAKKPGSPNILGVADPAIDALVEKVVFATDRADLVAATRALDRVLLWNHFVVPNWSRNEDWIAMWDQYAGPKTPPERQNAFLQTWWWDEAAAAKLKAARGN